MDTNVLVYSFDVGDERRQAQAVHVLNALFAARSGILSTQVLGEFCSTAMTKLEVPLGYDDVADAIDTYLHAFTVVPVTAHIVVAAVRAATVHRLSYWDAQIWAAAQAASCEAVLSEDFQHGRVIHDVRFVNPFAQDFDVEQLLAC